MPFLRLERQDGVPINQAGGGLCAFPAGAAGTDPETRLWHLAAGMSKGGLQEVYCHLLHDSIL